MYICLSFDDGRSDSYSNAYRILVKNNLKATFHVTTGFIDGTYPPDDFGLNRSPLTIDNIIEMHSQQMEICSHGDRHVFESNDFRVSINKLKGWGVIKDKYGFSIPNSKFTPKELESFIADNKTILDYVRVGRNPKCYTVLGKVQYALYRLFRSRSSFVSFNKHNLMKDVHRFSIYSSVIKRLTRPLDLISFLEQYENTEYKLVLMFHSIVDEPNDDWEWSTENFEQICSFLNKKKQTIKVLTLEELVSNEIGEQHC